jgi:mannose-6-phosphate isomerase-like protein (cupin superfamily)
VELQAGETVGAATLSANEHWIVLEGAVLLHVEALDVDLGAHDLALLRAGARRRLTASSGARLALAREVTPARATQA